MPKRVRKPKKTPKSLLDINITKMIKEEKINYANYKLPLLESKINALIKAIKEGKVKNRKLALKVLNKLTREKLALKNAIKSNEKGDSDKLKEYLTKAKKIERELNSQKKLKEKLYNKALKYFYENAEQEINYLKEELDLSNIDIDTKTKILDELHKKEENIKEKIKKRVYEYAEYLIAKNKPPNRHYLKRIVDNMLLDIIYFYEQIKKDV